jgi:hypothetical protein
MGFKVGDRVKEVKSGYTLGKGRPVTTGVVTDVLDRGCFKVKFDGFVISLFCRPGFVELLPDPPRKMHPDDFMLAINEFAADNGFGVTQLEFYGTEFIGSTLPRHSYSV